MLKHRAGLIPVLVFLTLPVIGRAQEKPVRAADVPREFKGKYEWRSKQKLFFLTLTIVKVEETDGTIRFTGKQLYDPGDYSMKITGTIDAKTRKVVIRESDPSQPDSDTDGQFEGTISTDLQTIEATWTSSDTGKQGDLKVQTKNAK